jgi:hypothetical protein
MKSENTLNATASKLNKLMVYSVETGLVTSISAVVAVAMFLAMPDSTYFEMLGVTSAFIYCS